MIISKKNNHIGHDGIKNSNGVPPTNSEHKIT